MNELIATSNQSRFNENTKIATKKDFDIYLAREYINPNTAISTIVLPAATEPLMFYQTRDSLADTDRYKRFIDNCVHRFRKSRTYKSYKAYLMSMGLDRCQINGNIQDGMADIEMHHNFLTIFDITVLISQHILNTVGRCTTFDIISLLAQEHKANNIPIVMLSETAHQLYHENPDFYIPISMTFGKWWDLLLKYRYGITLDIAYKVIRYISNCQENNELTNIEFFQLSDTIKSWGDYNEYNYYHGTSGQLVDYYGGYISNNDYECNQIIQNDQPDTRDSNGKGRILSEDELFGPRVKGPNGVSSESSFN